MQVSQNGRVVHVITGGAPPASRVHELIHVAQQAGWEVCVVATPEGAKFIDIGHLETLTGHPVRVEYKLPGQTDPLPPPVAVVVMPATFNTINKWALGIADTLAVSMLCEHMGRALPIIVVPYLKDELARHPAFREHLATLKKCGVQIMAGGAIGSYAELPSWEAMVQLLNDVTGAQSSRRKPRTEAGSIPRPSTSHLARNPRRRPG